MVVYVTLTCHYFTDTVYAWLTSMHISVGNSTSFLTLTVGSETGVRWLPWPCSQVI